MKQRSAEVFKEIEEVKSAIGQLRENLTKSQKQIESDLERMKFQNNKINMIEQFIIKNTEIKVIKYT